MSFDRMPQRLFCQNAVPVAATYTFTLDKSFVIKFLNDPLDGPLCDPNPRRNFPQHQIRFPGQQNQDVGMIRQKRPSSTTGDRLCFTIRLFPGSLSRHFSFLSHGTHRD